IRLCLRDSVVRPCPVFRLNQLTASQIRRHRLHGSLQDEAPKFNFPTHRFSDEYWGGGRQNSFRGKICTRLEHACQEAFVVRRLDECWLRQSPRFSKCRQFNATFPIFHIELGQPVKGRLEQRQAQVLSDYGSEKRLAIENHFLALQPIW